jgi:hypothetical protein
MKKMHCKRCGANENRIHGFCSVECENYYGYELRISELETEVKELKRGFSPSRKPARNELVLVDYKGTLYFGSLDDDGRWETSQRNNIRQYSGIRRWWKLPEVQE